MQLLWMVERLGAYAVLGRALYAKEIYRMNAAENVYNAKHARDNADDWVKWAENNPQAASLLARAEELSR